MKQLFLYALLTVFIVGCSSDDDAMESNSQIENTRILGIWEQVDECYYNDQLDIECFGINITYDIIEIKSNGDFIASFFDGQIDSIDSFEVINNEFIITQDLPNEPLYIEYSRILELTDTTLKLEIYKDNDSGEFAVDQIEILYFEKK